jgi:hypothetical protein
MQHAGLDVASNILKKYLHVVTQLVPQLIQPAVTCQVQNSGRQEERMQPVCVSTTITSIVGPQSAIALQQCISAPPVV